MASIKILKRDLNNVMGEIIEAAYIHQLANPKQDKASSEAIVDEAIATYDAMIVKINAKNVDNKAAHFKSINKEMEQEGLKLVEKLNAL